MTVLGTSVRSRCRPPARALPFPLLLYLSYTPNFTALSPARLFLSPHPLTSCLAQAVEAEEKRARILKTLSKVGMFSVSQRGVPLAHIDQPQVA